MQITHGAVVGSLCGVRCCCGRATWSITMSLADGTAAIFAGDAAADGFASSAGRFRAPDAAAVAENFDAISRQTHRFEPKAAYENVSRCLAT
jgi:hypothetical protein